MSPLLRPDPEGVRSAYRKSIANGGATLTDLFAAVDAEGEHRVLAHMYVSEALEALPGIDENRSAQIIGNAGIIHDEHLDLLGSNQRRRLIEAVAVDGDESGHAHQPRARRTRR